MAGCAAMAISSSSGRCSRAHAMSPIPNGNRPWSLATTASRPIRSIPSVLPTPIMPRPPPSVTARARRACATAAMGAPTMGKRMPSCSVNSVCSTGDLPVEWISSHPSVLGGHRRVSLHDQATTGPTRVLGHQPLHHQTPDTLSQPLSQPEVQLADDGRIGAGDVSERAALEHEVDPAASLDPVRAKASTGHLPFQEMELITGADQLRPTPKPILAAYLAGFLLVADSFDQEVCQPGVGARGAPSACRFRVQAIQQSRAAGTVAVLDIFNHQMGLFQHSQVLANSVVIESYVLGEFGYPYRFCRVHDVAEQPMARRIAESPSLALHLVIHSQIPPPIDVLGYTGITRARHSACVRSGAAADGGGHER